MKLKQRPEDFVVREAYRVDWDPRGPWHVYLMDKQKLSTFEAVGEITRRFRLPQRSVTFCGLKDKQGRTEQLIAVRHKEELRLQEPNLRLKFLGRTSNPLSSANLTANRFSITVRDLGEEEIGRIAPSVSEVRQVGVINYFDSQRFGALKHGQGFIAKDLIRGDVQRALYNYMARPSPLDASEDAKVKRFWAENWGNWSKRCPYRGVAKYRHILEHLQKDPKDFAGAFMRIETRYRTLLLYEYQSWLWNEGVRRLLLSYAPLDRFISLRYQAGRMLFPRHLPREDREDLLSRTFPLLGPDSTFDDPRTARAVFETLRRERLRLEDLAMPHLPAMFFKHEERPVVVMPEKLVLGKSRPDELNRGRFKINVAFTLPPGAYASLVTRRLFWFSVLEEEAKERGELHPAAEAMLTRAFGGPSSEVAEFVDEEEKEEEKPAREPRPKMGFLERQRRKKEARAQRRATSGPKTPGDAEPTRAKKPRKPRP